MLDVSDRRACRVIGQLRSTQRYGKRVPDDGHLLREQALRLASELGRYGYWRVTTMLRNQGWVVNHKRAAERIWRQEGLKVHPKQPKRGQLWLNDGSIVRLKPEFPKHVWSYDFMQDRTHNGVSFRILNEINDDWRASQRRYFSKESMRQLTNRDMAYEDQPSIFLVELTTNINKEALSNLHH